MMQPMAGPWLSPNEVTVKSFPMVFPDMRGIVQWPWAGGEIEPVPNHRYPPFALCQAATPEAVIHLPPLA